MCSSYRLYNVLNYFKALFRNSYPETEIQRQIITEAQDPYGREPTVLPMGYHTYLPFVRMPTSSLGA
jgi:hypothetical protein